MAPHVLQYLFDSIDCRREMVARGLDIDPSTIGSDKLGTTIVDRVVDLRDKLNLPAQLRELEPVDRDDFPAIAEFILDDPLIEESPVGLEPTTKEIEGVLHKAW